LIATAEKEKKRQNEYCLNCRTRGKHLRYIGKKQSIDCQNG
jgi:hypothetical protein